MLCFFRAKGIFNNLIGAFYFVVYWFLVGFIDCILYRVLLWMFDRYLLGTIEAQ
jgi:hypothetical protein